MLCDQLLFPVMRSRSVLLGGMSVKARNAAVDRINNSNREPVLVVATGPFVGVGFDCPALDTLFLAAPIAFKGRLVPTPVLASSLSKRAPGYTSLGFPDPRKAV